MRTWSSAVRRSKSRTRAFVREASCSSSWFDPAVAISVAPATLDRAAHASDGSRGLAPRARTETVLLPVLDVAQGRDDGFCSTVGDGVVEGAAGVFPSAVTEAIGSPSGICDNRQHRRVADTATGDFDRSQLERRLAHRHPGARCGRRAAWPRPACARVTRPPPDP